MNNYFRPLTSFCLFYSFIFIPVLTQAQTGQTRITEIAIYDQSNIAENPSFTVDTLQDDCNQDPDIEELEPYYDTMAGIKVKNDSYKDISFYRFNYRLELANSVNGKRIIRARKQGIAGNFLAKGNGETTEVLVFLLRAIDGRKYDPNGSFELPIESGFSNLKIRLIGRTEDGKIIRLRASTTLSIRNHDRC